jgi:hypothetical protein
VTFYRWRRKLGNHDAAGFGRGNVVLANSPFVSVSCPSPVVEFEFPGRAIARVPNDVESLRPLVQVLIDEGTSS